MLYGVKLLGMVCEAWPVPIRNPPRPLPAEALPPFLGAGTVENDLRSTEQLLAHIPGSIAISVSGSGHVAYLGGAGDAARRCVADHLIRYLTDLELPAPGVRCPMP